MNNSLFISAYYKHEQYFVNIKTFIIINIYQLARPSPLQLKLEILKEEPINNDIYISLSLNEVNFEIISSNIELTPLSKWPIILINNNYIVSGLCSVARQICKLSKNESVRQLLGFREACLVACAESSIWTKFCEIDITNTIEKLLTNSFITNDAFTLPCDVLKYENHLSQPVRVHNIYKIARDNQNDQSIKSSTARKDLRVLHDYAEGPYVTLSDVILFACFEIVFKYCQNISIESKLPLTKAWFNRLQKNSKLVSFNLQITLPKLETIIVPEINNVSLYNADPTRIVSTKHTKQYKIESALDLLKSINIKNNNLPFGYHIEFNWNCIPLEANPQGGALPAKRATRKCEQLENLVKATVAVVGDKTYTIVDFCSGSGHLGILVALVLPKCRIILVENKERSLARARETIAKLNLNNVIIVQSNLDYFVGTFDLGLALHACGVATDLVLQMCIKNKADFVCCPCCYGGIKRCHEVSYPRSENFKDMFRNVEEQYFNLAHAADQTHDTENLKTKQGYFCMDVIDSDRRFYAETYGYQVHLGKLQPVTCTNKNNLLVGVFNKID